MAERQPSKLANSSQNANKTHGYEQHAPIGAPKLPEVCRGDDQLDPALAAVVNAWPTMPEAVKTGILAMVLAAAKKP